MKSTKTIVFCILLAACIDPINLRTIQFSSLLVVESVLSDELKQHKVLLSRTSTLESKSRIPETGAQVSFKIGNGQINLSESEPGIYLTPTMSGRVGEKYQLFITTQDGKRYSSQAVDLKDTPLIDSLFVKFAVGVPSLGGGNGFQVLVNTGDGSAKPRYYRWEAEETWEIRTPFESNFVWLGGNEVVFRPVPVSVCYQTDTLSNVVIASTQSLGSDRVNQQLIQTIPSESRKMQVLYSILVRQYTLDQKAYLYWQTVQKTNQTQGGLYDTQPGTIIGNVTCDNNPNEPVLGYFDACVIRKKRIFVRPLEFRSAGFLPVAFGDYCRFLQQVPVPRDDIGQFYQDPSRSNLRILGASQGILFLLPKECCECTSIDKATTTKPNFWP